MCVNASGWPFARHASIEMGSIRATLNQQLILWLRCASLTVKKACVWMERAYQMLKVERKWGKKECESLLELLGTQKPALLKSLTV